MAITKLGADLHLASVVGSDAGPWQEESVAADEDIMPGMIVYKDTAESVKKATIANWNAVLGVAGNAPDHDIDTTNTSGYHLPVYPINGNDRLGMLILTDSQADYAGKIIRLSSTAGYGEIGTGPSGEIARLAWDKASDQTAVLAKPV